MKPAQSARSAGVVSLITTIIVGLLLLVVTTSAIAIMGTELRQSTNYNQGIAAYYAAEAGAEDAILHIHRQIAAGSTLAAAIAGKGSTPCDTTGWSENNLAGYGSGKLSADGVMAFTCQQVTLSQNPLTSKLRAEESTQIDMTGITNTVTQLQLDWNNQSVEGDPANYNSGNIPSNFSSGIAWQRGNYPAVMEATLIDYPRGVISFPSSSIILHTWILKPDAAGSNAASIQVSGAITSTTDPIRVTCGLGQYPPSSYDCRVTFKGLITSGAGARNYVLQLRDRYASQASYSLTALTSTGGSVAIPAGQLIIDVTGKTGDVYRRIRLEAPVNYGASNFVLLANDTICKVLSVTGGTANTETGCASGQ